jgi:Heterokaryon incompatibility protein (HET)/Nucleoside 2-deoxyribosyltransferase like/Leucine Rich repeats (2 copies)
MVKAQEWLDKEYPKGQRSSVRELKIKSEEEKLEGKLDLSGFDDLELLDCSNNKITKIAWPKNLSKLEKLDCSNNELTNIDLSRCSKLNKVICCNNKLEKIDFKNNTEIRELRCDKNELNDLDTKGCPNLAILSVRNNNLKSSIKDSVLRVGLNNRKISTKRDLTFLSHLTELKELYLGNIDKEKIQKGDYNRFCGSLSHLKNLKKLKVFDISNTDIDDGWEDLPESLMEVIFSQEIKKDEKKEKRFKVNLIKKFIENHLIIKKAANLPTFFERQREELEYYDPNPKKWGLKEKLEGKEAWIYKEIHPNDTLKSSDVKKYETKVKDLPTKLLKIPKGGELEVIESKNIENSAVYAILSYNWGREKQDQKEKERLGGETRNYSSFFFTEEQYEKYRLKDFNGKEITRDEIEKKSPAFAKTLLKAVEACRLLDIKYLWIDQLCVDQHNFEEKSDEVNQMSSYYGNGAITLVAVHKNISEKKVEKLDPVLAIKRIINSDWFQRSWTFQEGWLSKRTLFMFDDMLVDGGYLAQVWAYNQATDVKGKYSNRQEFEDQAAKIATPIGWVRYKKGYKPEDKLTFRLYEALRGIKDRKRSFPIDGIYSILGLLPYQVRPEYKSEYPTGYLQEELSRVMKEAAEKGYLEHLSWHGLGNNWIPKINKDGSTEVWGGMDISFKNQESFMKPKDKETISLILKKSKKYSIVSKIKDITKIGGDSVIGGVYSGTIELEKQEDAIKIWGTEEALESVQGGDFLVVPDQSELQSDTPFAILMREEEDYNHSRIGLVELTKEDEERLENKSKEELKKISINLDVQSEQDKSGQSEGDKFSDKKRVFLGGTCNGSTWREKLKPQIKIDYFDPVVEDWNEKAQETELRQREACDFLLYTITKEVEGFYAIAEVVEDSIKEPKRTIFCYLEEGFSEHQIKSLQAIAKMVKRNGIQAFTSLEEVAKYLNDGQLIEKNEDRQESSQEQSSIQFQIQQPPK